MQPLTIAPPEEDAVATLPDPVGRPVDLNGLGGKKIRFGRDAGFQAELKRRVDEFFRTTGRRERDCWQMYLKTGIIFATFAGSYILLVFFAQTWWQALPLTLLLGLSMAGIGFNVQHDGGHHAYSDSPWINRLMARSLDLMGGSSYIWHWKHAVLHHTYANITDHDTDIDLGPLGRLEPHRKRLWFHRWQHIYLWPLYGFLAMKWHFFDDFRDLVAGQLGTHHFPRPRGKDLAVFLGGKTLFFTLMFVIPLLRHPVWVVLGFYVIGAAVLGLVLSVVFQLAHAVEAAQFPLPQPETGAIENSWAIHQVETTVDFARRSPIAAWLLGGLNFQIEHHLFPRICHINYPAISPLVEQTCREFGVQYAEHTTFAAGIISHLRFLKQMGLPTPSA
ncbi:MAG: fatty acid desaturase family protein [Planctomycetales bacterium]